MHQHARSDVLSVICEQDLGFKYSMLGRLGGDLRGSQIESLWLAARYVHFLDDERARLVRQPSCYLTKCFVV